MDTLRAVLATLALLAGIACLIHGFSGGPLWLCLGGTLLFFLLAYWLWPRGRWQDSPWLDVLEMLVELPVSLLLWLLRQLGRLFRDIDLPGP
jgi:hypothetical protein